MAPSRRPPWLGLLVAAVLCTAAYGSQQLRASSPVHVEKRKPFADKAKAEGQASQATAKALADEQAKLCAEEIQALTLFDLAEKVRVPAPIHLAHPVVPPRTWPRALSTRVRSHRPRVNGTTFFSLERTRGVESRALGVPFAGELAQSSGAEEEGWAGRRHASP